MTSIARFGILLFSLSVLAACSNQAVQEALEPLA